MATFKNMWILAVLVFGSLQAEAKIEVLFHPTDPTLEKVAEWFDAAHGQIDISMYSMDTTAGSPVMKKLMEPAMQARLKSGELSIRMIFEGYGTKPENEKKMADLEAVGIDARFMKSGKMVHHKFAVIDPGASDARLITGSANWSASSYRGYDENMLFMEQEPEAIVSFETEFTSLWDSAEEYGVTLKHSARATPSVPSGLDHMDVFFNSMRVLFKQDTPETYLASHVERLIANAKSEVLIATTRIRLESLLGAVKSAAARGVKVKILISQDDYHDLYKRADSLFNQPNLELRIKFYNLKPSQYITYQMHNKFLIVDREEIGTGSYNWSDSSENGHVENFIELKSSGARDVMSSYLARFEMLWDRGRAEFPAYTESLTQKKARGELPACGFAPTSLSYEEVRALLKLAPKCGATSAAPSSGEGE